MAGHSKWSTIKRHKKLIDNQKSKIFSILSKEISNISIKYGPDPKTNFKLRNLIEKAKSNNMPNIKIKEAINRTIIDVNNLELINYEAYGPYGIGYIIQTITNYKNNINFLLNNIFKKYNGHLAKSKEVIFNFNKKTQIILNKDIINEETYNKLKLKIEKNILFCDFIIKNNYYEILIENKYIKNIQDILKKEKIFSYNINNNFFIPKYFIYINKENYLSYIVKLKNELKNIKDIKNIFTNEKLK